MMKLWLVVFVIGALLFVEGMVAQTEWMQYGIPSIILNGFWLHHWMIGGFLMSIAIVIKNYNPKKVKK